MKGALFKINQVIDRFIMKKTIDILMQREITIDPATMASIKTASILLINTRQKTTSQKS